MEVGLFGKLPAKRDFISYGVDRAFLELWEPWVQAAISASRDQLAQGWLPAYMNAPIWRFWLGPSLCGRAVAGAVMPSVDGVGRYFPLSLVAQGIDMAPPTVEAQGDWFDAAETVLLDALEEGRAFDATLAALGALPPPAPPRGSTVESAFAAVRHQAEPDFHDDLTCWWVRPQGTAPARVMIRRGMPGPYDFVEMIRPVEPPPQPVAEPEAEPLVLTKADVSQGAAPAAAAATSSSDLWGQTPVETTDHSASDGDEPLELTLTGAVGPAPVASDDSAEETSDFDGDAADSGDEPLNGADEAERDGSDTAPQGAGTAAGDTVTGPKDDPADEGAGDETAEDEDGAFVLSRDMAVKADV